MDYQIITRRINLNMIYVYYPFGEVAIGCAQTPNNLASCLPSCHTSERRCSGIREASK